MERKAINRDKRTVEVAFSSEAPVEDWPGLYHILDHSESAVDLARLNAGGAVLVDHRRQRESHVGTVAKAWIGDDRVGRALLRFSKRPIAEELWQDVLDEIVRDVSVGADIIVDGGEAVIRDPSSTKDRTVWRIMRWRPIEVSFVTTGADENAGVGRNLNRPVEVTKVQVKDDQQPSEAAVRQAREQAAAQVADRLNEIYAIGREYNCEELAREWATNRKTSDEELMQLRRKAFDAYVKAKEAEIEREERDPKPLTELGLTSAEARRYSLSRALVAMLPGATADEVKAASFELECSKEIEKRLERGPEGIFIPWELQMLTRERRGTPKSIRRTMTTTGTGTGEELVGNQLSPENFIEQLRNNVVVAARGARMLPGLRQNLDLPKKTSGATFAWLAEGGTVTLSDLGTGLLSLTPKTVGGGVQATRRMLKQSIPAIDDMIMQDLAEGAAEVIDLGALQGSGASNQPTGVFNTSGVNTQTVTAAGNPTYAEVIGFRTAVAVDNALRGSLGWVTTSTVVGNMMQRALDAGSGRFLMDPVLNPNNCIGYSVSETNQLTAGRIIFGNWAEVILGMWGVLDLRPDPFTLATSDGLVIRAFQDLDVGVRHAVSFCVSA